MDIVEVKKWYKKRYTRILNALEQNGFKEFEIDKSCGVYLELTCVKNGVKYKFNHGISDAFPYNSWKYNCSWLGGKERFHYINQNELAQYILSL